MSKVIKLTDTNNLINTSEYKYAKWPFEKFNPVQSQLFEIYKGNSNVAIAAATSAGKAQPLDSKVLTPNGFVKMKDIKIGDKVISKNGNYIKVTNVFPQGKKDVYKVVFNDETSTRCCEEHLWFVKEFNKEEWKTISLKEIKNSNYKEQKWEIPLLEFDEKIEKKFELPLNPYVFGLILGNYKAIKKLIFNCPNKKIIQILQDNFLNLHQSHELSENLKQKFDYLHHNSLSIKDSLILMGLSDESNTFIPEIYKNSDYNSRLFLLRGLMDSNTISSNNKIFQKDIDYFEFNSEKFSFAKDVCDLVRSLGGISKIEQKKYFLEFNYTVCVNIGKKNPYFCLKINEKHQSILEEKRKRYIKDIIKVEKEECQCISVDCPYQLYVTDDYILTHNTVCSEMYLAYEIRNRGGKGVYVGPLKALAKEKEIEWTDKEHHFSDLKTFIATGDFRFTNKRIKEMEESNLIIMTPEMLASRCRNYKSDKSKFLNDVGTLVFDECFTEDALVLTEIGYVPIGLIIERKLNIKVASFNHEKNIVEYKKIVEFQKKNLNKKWYAISYEGGSIVVTENQSIWVENKGYVEAKNINKGDVLLVNNKNNQIELNSKKNEFSNYSKNLIKDLINLSFKEEEKLTNKAKVLKIEYVGWNPLNNKKYKNISKSDFDFLKHIVSKFRKYLVYSNLVEKNKNSSNFIFEIKESEELNSCLEKNERFSLKEFMISSFNDENLDNPEESVCCDLEIEGNNNFFVMQPGSNSPVLCHNSHLLGVPSRGDHIEVSLMKLTEINPNARIVLLSATMPNVFEICDWVSKITGRETYYLESDYRPCPLNIHYETYYDGDRMYDDKEASKIGTACAIVDYYQEDKFLIFVHTKRTGELMVNSLSHYGIESKFHNADLDLKGRMDLEDKFKNDKNFRVLVATSTLAWGLNLPARRVIITGVHRGLSEVENYDIQQMIGRAGRPKYDPRGDAYILIPESDKEYWINKLKKKPAIKSTLLDYAGKHENPNYKTLAFHVVAEIYQENIKTKKAFEDWFQKSLANFQNCSLDDKIIERTLNSLEKCKAIYLNTKGEYECTSIGKIASMFYYSPFDVSDLKKNFSKLFTEKKQLDDFSISLALGNIDTYRFSIINRQEKDAVTGYRMQIEKMYGVNSVTDPIYKIGCSYFNMLNGKKNVPVLKSTTGALLVDLDRTLQVLIALNDMSCKWDQKDWFKNLGLRLRYGVKADLVELCQIPNVGAVRATKLKSKNIKNLDDFIGYNAETLSKIMNCGLKIAQDSLDEAKKIKLNESIS
jgi:replicative superfamily II helicase